MTPDDPWLMRVESGLSAHFKQPGGSVPGVVWSIGMKKGEEIYKVTVKALLTADASDETRKDQQYQAQTVMQYLRDQLNRGWDPRQPREHTIWIGNPPDKRGVSSSDLRDAVPASLIVILTENPDPKSNILDLQDFIRDGRSFLPIFRSHESFQQATRGTVNKPVYQIDRRLFASLLRGSETVILDAGLPEEIVTSADAFKRIFPEPFDPSN